MSNHCTWSPFRDQEDAQDMVGDLPDHPNIWTDGSREPIPHLDVEIDGAGAFSHSPATIFDSNRWGHTQDLDGRFLRVAPISFLGFSVPAIGADSRILGCYPSSTSQLWNPVGIDNLYVLRGVAKFPDTVKVSKVKGMLHKPW